jgi:hypothetical protein
MSNRFTDILEDILITTLDRGRHPGIECAYDELKRDRFANKDFDGIFGELCDMMEDLGLEERDRDFDKVAKRLSVMLICEWADDEGMTDRLRQRDEDEVQKQIEDLKDIRYEIENPRDSRRDSRRGGRRGSSRRDDDFRTGDRSSSRRRGGRGRDDRDEPRRGSRKRPGDGFRNRRRNNDDDNTPKTAVQRKAELARQDEVEVQEDRPLTPAEIRRQNRDNGGDRSYNYVAEGENAVATPLTKTEQELGFAYTEVPQGTLTDYRELGINVEDPEFIKTRAVDREDTFRTVLYDPYVKQPVWVINDKGLRVLRWRDFNMNIDNHVIPDFQRSPSTPRRPQGDNKVLSAVTQPSRRSILDIQRDTDKADRQYEDKLNEWEVNNKDRAEDEQEAKPESPALQRLGSHTLRVEEAVETSSLADMIQETMLRFADVRVVTEGMAPVESFGNRRRFALIADNPAHRDEIMQQVEMFTVGHSHRNADNTVVPIHKYHAALMAVVDTIPHGLWVRINRRLTNYVNDIFAISLGLSLSIDDFATDGDSIVQYLHDKYGEAVLAAFIIAHAQVGGRLSMLEAGKGETDLMIYEVEGTQVTILPVTPDELSISSVQLDSDNKHGTTALVTGESNLRLFNALRTVTTQSTPVMGKQAPYKYIAFSDGSVFRIDRNAMGLSGTTRNDAVEFLLTQVSYC